MEKEFITLYELQSGLKEGIERLYPSRFWLKAEISALKARPGGHCYMELSQSDDSGIVAKAQAVIWSSRYRFIAPYFESVTGSPLREGMLVLIQVQVNFSQLYGLSLVVNDIDPDFSTGEQERLKRETLERLRREGLADMQKGLGMPAIPYRMALMQGSGSPSSIMDALDRVASAQDPYEVVAILRGGGAKLDLACYDDYDLAAHIAQFPIPVLTAIGHDQDSHAADLVAYGSVKTPTALADELVSLYASEDSRLLSYTSRLKLSFSGRLYREESRLQKLLTGISRAFSRKISDMEGHLSVLEARITASDPANILKKGYVLAVDSSGTVIKGVRDRRPGDRVGILMKDGRLDCTVDSVSRLPFRVQADEPGPGGGLHGEDADMD